MRSKNAYFTSAERNVTTKSSIWSGFQQKLSLYIIFKTEIYPSTQSINHTQL